MAEIFLARTLSDSGSERICAVKRILPHHAQEKEFVEMFRAEAALCKRLQHPNIAQVYDFKKVDGNYALIMEFVNGTDFRTFLAACEKSKVRLTVPMAVFAVAQAARGLHYAHTRVDDASGRPLGIVHRDISPQNILCSYDGEVKVIDFGIANFDAKSNETKPGVVKGKYSYMSPEQVTAKKVDARTDVFSLAIVLWEILAMRRLFSADTEIEIIRNVQQAAIRHPLNELNPAVDRELMQIITHGLERDRKVRYQSCAALEKDLMTYLAQKYPDFKPIELGNLLKQIMGQKRTEMERDVEKLMAFDISEFNEAAPDSANRPITLLGEAPIASQHEAQFTSSNLASQRTMTNAGSIASKHTSSIKLPDQRSVATPMQQAAAGFNGRVTSGGRPQTSGARFAHSRSQRGATRSVVTLPTGYAQVARRSSPHPMVWIFLVVLLLGVGFIARQELRPKRATFEYTLNVEPAGEIRLILNGKIVNNGKLVETPRKLNLPSGTHILTVQKSGFRDQVLTIKGDTGERVIGEIVRLLPSPQSGAQPLQSKPGVQPPSTLPTKILRQPTRR